MLSGSGSHRWGVAVSGNYSWFGSFVARHNPVDVGFIVDHYDAEPDQHLLVSPHVDGLSDPQIVADRIRGLLTLLDGALYLQHGLFAGLRLGDMHDLRSGANHGFIEGDPLADPFPAASSSTVVARRRGDLAQATARMIHMARTDDVTRGMLSFLGVNGATWITLYALMDYMVREGWTHERIGKAANSGASEVKRFTQTANNPAAVGPFARHGEKGWKPPGRPMSLDEAKLLMLVAAGRFLDERAAALGVQEAYDARARP